MSRVIEPKKFFGFEIGEDRKLARWDKIVKYYYHVADNSDRVKVESLGRTPDGNEFIVAYVSSPDNLRNLDTYREISCRLANPDTLPSEEEAQELIEKGKTVVLITHSIHATEVGGTQMSIKLVYELATSNDPAIKEILDNVITIIIPSFNPDGQVMVVDYYNKYLGTEYEGSPLPWLYHKYCGHDNNRDAYTLNLVESRFFAKIAYQDWCPQIYIDHHQMGSYGARFFISPEMDPIDPEVDPINWRETQFIGMYAASKLESSGIKGVETGYPFTPDFISAFQTISYYMNIIGILTESASVRIASPLYIHPHQLKGSWRGRKEYRPYMNFPNPWPGGWWRLSDIVRQQFISTIAILEAAAKFRRELLRNSYLKAKRNIERGKTAEPLYYIIPASQHDPLTMLKLVKTLIQLGVKVYRADGDIRVDRTVFESGSFVVPLSQARRALIKRLLGRYFYPDYEATRSPDGKPIKPYDTATDTLAEFMGVEVFEAKTPISGKISKVVSVEYPKVDIDPGARGYILDPRLNDTYRVVNRLLSRGFPVYRLFGSVSIGDTRIPPGGFYISNDGDLYSVLREYIADLGVPAYSVKDPVESFGVEYRVVEHKRLGVHQRYYMGNMEEGWIRFVLDTFEFPYKSIKDDIIKDKKLSEHVDLLVFPSDTLAMLKGENVEEELAKIYRRPIKLPPFPPEYRSGFGNEGVDYLKDYVSTGGELVLMGLSVELAIKGFKLPLHDVTEDLKDPSKFFCPGSTLKIDIDTEHPLGFGMPKRAYAMFMDRPILEIIPSHMNDRFKVVAKFTDRDVLQSGWLIGEENIRGKPALIEASMGKGKIYLYGFRPIFRAWMHGTFKLFFNALYKYREA